MSLNNASTRLSLLALALMAVLPFVLPKFLVLQLGVALSFAIAILGLNLLLGFAGQVCLAQGAFFACGAYTTAILVTRLGVDPLLTLPLAAAVTACMGIAIGLPALRLGGLQLAIVTFGLAVITPQLILKFDGLTHGVTGISFEPPRPPGWLPVGADTWLYLIGLIAMAVCVLVMRRLLAGDTGRALRALRDDPLIARSLGVNLTRVRLSAFAVSSAFAGLGGGVYALLNAYVSPQSFLAGRSIEILIGAIVGGITSIAGAFLGALFVVFVPEWTADFSPALGGIIYGACLIAMMVTARDGLAGLCLRALSALKSWRSRTRSRRPPLTSGPAPSNLTQETKS